MDITKPLCVRSIALADCNLSTEETLVVSFVAPEDAFGLVLATVGPAGDPDSEAYARLFAAAPALLAALQQIVTTSDALLEHRCEVNWTALQFNLVDARAAISLADTRRGIAAAGGGE